MASCLSHRFVFGVQGSRSNAIAFSDQATIVYVAGHNIVIYNILEGKQRFIHGSELSESIAAMALCPSARFVALAEAGEKPTVRQSNVRSCSCIHVHAQNVTRTFGYATTCIKTGFTLRSSHAAYTQDLAE